MTEQDMRAFHLKVLAALAKAKAERDVFIPPSRYGLGGWYSE